MEKKTVCFTKACGFQGKATCRLDVNMDVNILNSLWCLGVICRKSQKLNSQSYCERLWKKKHSAAPTTGISLPFPHDKITHMNLPRAWDSVPRTACPITIQTTASTLHQNKHKTQLQRNSYRNLVTHSLMLR